MAGRQNEALFADAHRETERLLNGIHDAEREHRLAHNRAVEAQEHADNMSREVGRWEKAYAEHIQAMKEERLVAARG